MEGSEHGATPKIIHVCLGLSTKTIQLSWDPPWLETQMATSDQLVGGLDAIFGIFPYIGC